jgi:hypothetical protein
MKKEEMITLLRSVSCDENTVTAMTNAYEMGFDYGSKAYVYLTEAVEEAKRICEQLDSVVGVVCRDPSTADFWKAMKKLQELE